MPIFTVKIQGSIGQRSISWVYPLAEFAEALKTLATDAEVEAWLKANHPKSEADIEAYNERMKQMGPATDEGYTAMMAKMLSRIAPERTDINTWFALMALDDEKTFAL